MLKKNRLKARTLWLIVLGCFLLVILLIHLINNINNPRPLLWLVMILMIIMAIVIQLAMTRTFRYKPRSIANVTKSYELKDFDSIEKKLMSENFILRKAKYGVLYSKIFGKTIIKVSIIKDASIYFSNEQEEVEPTKGIENCTKMIGIDIFYENTDEIKEKTPQFLLQASNIYYEAFYYEESLGQIIRPNVETILEQHEQDYNKIKKILGFTKVVGEENEV